MPGRIERTYGKLFKYAMLTINPFKKSIIKTECIIHQYINLQALEILKNDNFLDAYSFFSDYIVQLNAGVIWADQDFKSAGHFYNPIRGKGLYGNNNALLTGSGYFDKSLNFWSMGDVNMSMFYLGAAVHIVQDMTVPQHANIRLLDDHRQYENFIKRVYVHTPEFAVHRGGYYLSGINEFIRCNARNAMRIYRKLRNIEDDAKRFYTIAKFTLPLAQKTTAGSLLNFYKDAVKRN